MRSYSTKYKLQPKGNLKIYKSNYFDIKNYYVYIGIKSSARNKNFQLNINSLFRI